MILGRIVPGVVVLYDITLVAYDLSRSWKVVCVSVLAGCFFMAYIDMEMAMVKQDE